MLTSFWSQPPRIRPSIHQIVFALALLYAATSVVVDALAPRLHLLVGLRASLLLFAAGSSPLAVLLIFGATQADRLGRPERRALLVGAGASALILVPLLSLVL